MRPVRTFAALSMAVLAAAAAVAAPASAHAGTMAGGLGSPLLAPGDTFELSLDGPGTYDVHCHLHANMVGRLVVLPGTAPEGPSVHRVALRDGSDGLGGSFVDAAEGGATTTAYAGDVVLWTNVGNQTHDVHLAPATAPDNGMFETVVLVGLAVSLAAIVAISRRR